MVLQAWRDCHNTNGAKAAREAGISPGVGLAGDARLFLESDGAAWLLALLELDAGTIDEIRSVLPPVKWRQLPLFVEV